MSSSEKKNIFTRFKTCLLKIISHFVAVMVFTLLPLLHCLGERKMANQVIVDKFFVGVDLIAS